MSPKPSESDIQAIFLKAIRSVAPEAELASLDPELPLRDQIEIDSMDFFNILVRVHKELGVEIPETDYGKFRSLKSAVSYLKSKIGEHES